VGAAPCNTFFHEQSATNAPSNSRVARRAIEDFDEQSRNRCLLAQTPTVSPRGSRECPREAWADLPRITGQRRRFSVQRLETASERFSLVLQASTILAALFRDILREECLQLVLLP
jgi:hypothetical protein